MREFLSQVLSHREKFLYASISYKELMQIQNIVIESLKLNNINELRDKYDGVWFTEKFSAKIFGVLAIEKVLKTQFVDWDNLDPRRYVPRLSIEGENVDVIMSSYGDFPIINKNNSAPAIICIKKDKRDVIICGFATIEMLNKYQSNKFLKGEMMKDLDSKTTFTGFKELIRFDTFEELKNLTKKN